MPSGSCGIPWPSACLPGPLSFLSQCLPSAPAYGCGKSWPLRYTELDFCTSLGQWLPHSEAVSCEVGMITMPTSWALRRTGYSKPVKLHMVPRPRKSLMEVPLPVCGHWLAEAGHFPTVLSVGGWVRCLGAGLQLLTNQGIMCTGEIGTSRYTASVTSGAGTGPRAGTHIPPGTRSEMLAGSGVALPGLGHTQGLLAPSRGRQWCL